MDKYDYKMRADEIRLLISEKKFEEAVVIADEIDWKNVKNGMMLCTISDLYKVCKRYEDARAVLQLAYMRNPSGRMILYSLCELSIKLDDIVMAIEYYKEYLQVAPRDTGRFILQYKLYEAQEVSLEERIAVLEELQKRECREKWMYELAFLYHRMGLGSSCVDECNQIVTFFGEGKYVIKALELKKLHEELSPSDDNLYERLTGTGAEAIKIGDMNVGKYNTIDLQKELADNLKEVLGDAESREREENYKELVEEPIIGSAAVIENSASDFVESEATEAVAKEDSANQNAEPSLTEEAPDAEQTPLEADKEEEEMFAVQSLESAESISASKPESSDDLAKTRIFEINEWQKSIGAGEAEVEYLKNLPANEIDNMLSLEGDGQISMVMHEEPVIEKQITGQICIDEVLLEWEKVKRESEQRWTEDLSKKMQEKKDDLLKSIREASNIEYELEEINIPEEPVKEEAVTEIPVEEYEEIYLDEDEFILLDEEVQETVPMEEAVAEKAPAPEETEEDIKIYDAADDIMVNEVVADDIMLAGAEASTVAAAVEAEEIPSDVNPVETVEEVVKEAATETAGDSFAEPATDSASEPESEDNTSVLPNGDELDYLIQYAEASKRHDEEMAVMAAGATVEAAETLVSEAKESLEEEQPVVETVETTQAVENEEIVSAEAESSEEAKENPITKEIVAPLVNDPEASEPALAQGDFSDEQFDRFESYIYTDTGREQITEAIQKISMVPTSGNAIIGSQDKDGSIELAKALIMELSNKEEVTGKVAKIKASSLNAKDAKETFSKINEGALIILDANELRKETINELNEFLAGPGVRTFVALTMLTRYKHKFIMNNGDLLKAFDIKIDVEPVDDVELVKFAKKYAYELEYSINEMGSLALHTKIDELQTNSHNVTISEVKDIVDQAIRHASKKNVGHLFDIIFGKRYDEDDMVVLGEKDFAD